jgi:hypothetical protein
MSQPTNTPIRRTTLEVPRDQWNIFLTEFTRQNRGAHARLDVFGPDVSYQVETEDRPFDGVAADIKDRESSAWITLGSTPDNHLTHGVHGVTIVRALPATDTTGAVLELEAKDGIRTVLELSRPDDYALPSRTQVQ